MRNLRLLFLVGLATVFISEKVSELPFFLIVIVILCETLND